jgi:hypothetical protein
MPMSIREMSPGDAEGIREFNTRLQKAGVIFTFPVSSRELMQRDPGVDAPYQTAYVLTDGPSVRGGYILKDEQLFASGEYFSAGNYQLPLSEGIVDRKYAIVGVQLIKDALARQTRLYCLGMGSRARPLPQLLSRLGWAVSEVPFLFRIENAGNFTREIRWLRQRGVYRHALDIARHSGLLAGVVGLARLRRRVFGPKVSSDVSVSEVARLPEDIDELFSRVRGDYGLLCDRRAAAMNKKLPPQEPKLSRLLVYRSGRLAGWVILSISRLPNHTQFGNMKVGCVVDGLAAPADVGIVVAEACKRLGAAACDLLVSNQSHSAWIAALRRHGFFTGPSNFVLALSKDLAARAAGPLRHFTRADGDGPINL